MGILFRIYINYNPPNPWNLYVYFYYGFYLGFIEGNLEIKFPIIWTDEKQSREEVERRGKLEERKIEEKESEERRYRYVKR